MSLDSMFNKIALSSYSGSNFFYTWDFGDGSATSSDSNAVYTYLATGQFNITLTATYANGACSDDVTKPITVNALPDFRIEISPPETVCSGDTITLSAPQIYDFYLWSNASESSSILVTSPGDYKVTVTVPLRAIFAVNLSRVRRVGWISSPRLNVDVFGVSPWKVNLGLSTGPVFGDRNYHDYFYSVDPEFANLDREAYSAPGGYSGTQLTLSASKRVAKWWFGAFVRGDFLSGAAFRQSPLLKARESVMAGVSVSWSFAESTTLVTVDE